MKNKILIEVICFLVVCICICVAILGFAIKKVDTKPYFEPAGRVGAVYEPTDPSICDLTDVICPNEPKIIYAQVTKYTKIETCPNHQCRTANGDAPTKNEGVACPRSIPLGTRVKIEEKTVVCNDRTARKYDGRFDIYNGTTQEDYQEALAWGVKTLPITILN